MINQTQSSNMEEVVQSKSLVSSQQNPQQVGQSVLLLNQTYARPCLLSCSTLLVHLVSDTQTSNFQLGTQETKVYPAKNK